MGLGTPKSRFRFNICFRISKISSLRRTILLYDTIIIICTRCRTGPAGAPKNSSTLVLNRVPPSCTDKFHSSHSEREFIDTCIFHVITKDRAVTLPYISFPFLCQGSTKALSVTNIEKTNNIRRLVRSVRCQEPAGSNQIFSSMAIMGYSSVFFN